MGRESLVGVGTLVKRSLAVVVVVVVVLMMILKGKVAEREEKFSLCFLVEGKEEVLFIHVQWWGMQGGFNDCVCYSDGVVLKERHFDMAGQLRHHIQPLGFGGENVASFTQCFFTFQLSDLFPSGLQSITHCVAFDKHCPSQAVVSHDGLELLG